jgi:hypothetical protein
MKTTMTGFRCRSCVFFVYDVTLCKVTNEVMDVDECCDHYKPWRCEKCFSSPHEGKCPISSPPGGILHKITEDAYAREAERTAFNAKHGYKRDMKKKYDGIDLF